MNMVKNRGYTRGHETQPRSLFMPKQNTDDLTEFGKRLSALRKQAGYTQTELAQELGVSQRMISYYEGDTDYPPVGLLPNLAKLPVTLTVAA
jgi:DNA-binding XRE family transcriptional regulator